MSGLMAFNYQMPLDKLAVPSWLVDTFRRYLKFSMQIVGRPLTKLEDSPLVPDLIRSERESRTSWRLPGTKSLRHSNGRHGGVCSGS
jgi:hypothetical protein